MVGFFEKKMVCLSCRNRVMQDTYEEKAHLALDHKLMEYTFGGYKKGPQEDPKPIQTKTAEKLEPKMDLGLADMEEDALEPEEEDGQR